MPKNLKCTTFKYVMKEINENPYNNIHHCWFPSGTHADHEMFNLMRPKHSQLFIQAQIRVDVLSPKKCSRQVRGACFHSCLLLMHPCRCAGYNANQNPTAASEFLKLRMSEIENDTQAYRVRDSQDDVPDTSVRIIA